MLQLAAANLVAPITLFFALGVLAALARSDLSIPESAAKALSIYLLFAIGFKGGVSLASYGVDATMLASLLAGALLSAMLPLIAFVLIRLITQLDTLNCAAVAGHYGSISIVTFVAATSVLDNFGIASEGYMVAVAAIMEAPAILSALWLASRNRQSSARMDDGLWREILLNGSIVLLIGSFIIGMITGENGLKEIESFIVSPFKGVLCLFMLDMGLLAGRSLAKSRQSISKGLIAFGIIMPVTGAIIALPIGYILGLSEGGTVLLMVLCASASYIAVPAAMRVALPEADPGIYLTLSLGVTFPFNLTLGIPLYIAAANILFA